MKTGLVLEGGAMRGLFSAGVMDVMLEQGFHFDGIVGVSAGAAFGCNYKSHQPGRTIRYNTRFCRDPRYCSLRSLLRTGDLFGAEFCYHTLPDQLDPFDAAAFARDPAAFHVVCTDVQTGKAVYHSCTQADHTCMEWIRASASMPLVSRVVRIGAQQLLDGGIADPIPLRYFEQMGFSRNVVILTQPENYRKGKSRALFLMRLLLARYPHLVDALSRRHLLYNDTLQHIRRQEQAGTVLVVRPDAPLPIGRIEHDASAMDRVYQLGRSAALARLSQLKVFLQP